jgi:undecaprenyl phosphate-alpha-L-ara4N flippase subunit ArnF
MHYLYVGGTVLFTVYGQIILKWRIKKLDWTMVDDNLPEQIKCYLKLFFDPYILSCLFSAFIASVFWVMAMSKLELTTTYPFMSLSPAIVFLLGIYFLDETFTIGKLLGLVLIIIGVIVTVKL